MATFFIGLNTGLTESEVTSSVSTTSKDVEVVLNTTENVPDIQSVLNALTHIQKYLLHNAKGW